jgi:hypothetical protein
MTYTGFFVDDEDEEYAEQLSTGGALEVRFLPVDEIMVLAAEIAKAKVQLVALDYRLDETAAKLTVDRTFKGSALAQHLRDKAVEEPTSDMALILVSAESKVRTLYRPDKTAHDLFDRVYIKEEINADRARSRAEVLSLAEAYDKLRAVQLPYDLVELTRAKGEDADVIGVQEFRLKVEEAKAPHHLVRSIFAMLIDHSGPLLDRDDLCAFLGVARVDGTKIEPLLSETRYQGIFGETWPRWWTHRVETWALGVFKRRPTGLPAFDRAKIFREELDCDVAPAISPWTKSPNELVAIACACCRHGVEIAHTVAVFEPALPKVSARRRICWDCVQTDRYFGRSPPLIVDDVDSSLAEEVKKMARPAVDGGATG